MSSPFKVFRKHQKWLIATAGLFAIFAFVFADPLTNMMQGRAGIGPKGPAAVSDHGSISERRLANMLQMRFILNSFLERAFRMGVEAGGRFEERPIWRPRSEESVVTDMLLAKKAEELGFVISDKVVNDYLKKLTGDSLRPSTLRTILDDYSLPDRRVDMGMIFGALREVLLVTKLEASYVQPFFSQFGAGAVTPGQTWEYYRRLQDSVQVELLPIPVESFVDQVPEPSDSELAEFFETHKNQHPQRVRFGEVEMEGPDPGFKQPVRMAFASVKLDMETVVKLNTEEVTDEEIAAYYEENKSLFEIPTLIEEDEPLSVEETADEEGEAADETPGPPEPADESEAPEETDADSSSDEASDETSEETSAAPAETPTEYQPLEEVAEDIRNTLAKDPERVQARREELLSDVTSAMASYASQKIRWRNQQDDKAEDEPDTPTPSHPDIQQMADDSGLIFEEIAILSFYEMRDRALGRSLILVDGRQTEQFSHHSFSGRMSLLKPVMTVDSEGNAYAAWRTEEIASHVPEFEKIRPEVVKAWKMTKALDLAQEEAQRLQEEAGKSGKPLREFFADRKDPPLLLTEPFSWITFGPVPSGNQGRRPRLSTVDGVEGADPKFMESIFRLQEGEVGTAMNYSQRMVYVTRIARHEVPLKTLRERFLRIDEVGSSRQLASRELGSQVLTSLRDQVTQGTNLDWRREPDTQRE